MTTEELHNFNVANEEILIVKDFLYLGSIITPTRACSQKIRKRLGFGRAAMKELETIIKCKDVSKAKIIHTLVFPITMYGYKSYGEEG